MEKNSAACLVTVLSVFVVFLIGKQGLYQCKQLSFT